MARVFESWIVQPRSSAYEAAFAKEPGKNSVRFFGNEPNGRLLNDFKECAPLRMQSHYEVAGGNNFAEQSQRWTSQRFQ
jgi:hypothetical protein